MIDYIIYLFLFICFYIFLYFLIKLPSFDRQVIKCFELLRFSGSLSRFYLDAHKRVISFQKSIAIASGIFAFSARLVDSASPTRIPDRTDRPFPKISRWPIVDINRIHRAIGTTSRRRIRQMISRRSIAHVAEFISRTRHFENLFSIFRSFSFSISAIISI